MKATKARAFHEAQSPPQAHAFDDVCLFPLLLLLSLLLLAFFFAVVTIAGTRVPVCCNSGQNNVVWSLWDIKQRRFGLFYFFKSLPKKKLFGTKSLIQMTSFWISDLKQFQNDVVLGCVCELKKKKTATIQNDAVLY